MREKHTHTHLFPNITQLAHTYTSLSKLHPTRTHIHISFQTSPNSNFKMVFVVVLLLVRYGLCCSSSSRSLWSLLFFFFSFAMVFVNMIGILAVPKSDGLSSSFALVKTRVDCWLFYIYLQGLRNALKRRQQLVYTHMSDKLDSLRESISWWQR